MKESETNKVKENCSLKDVEKKEMKAHKRPYKGNLITEGKKFFKEGPCNAYKSLPNFQSQELEAPSLEIRSSNNLQESKEVYKKDEIYGDSQHVLVSSSKNLLDINTKYPPIPFLPNFEKNNFLEQPKMQVKSRRNLLEGEMQTINNSMQKEEMYKSKNTLCIQAENLDIPLKRNKKMPMKELGANKVDEDIDMETYKRSKALNPVLENNSRIKMDDMNERVNIFSSGKDGWFDYDLKEETCLSEHFKNLCKVSLILDKALNELIKKRTSTTYENLRKSILNDTQVYYIKVILIESLQ